jgi:hypothetical protein
MGFRGLPFYENHVTAPKLEANVPFEGGRRLSPRLWTGKPRGTEGWVRRSLAGAEAPQNVSY